MALVRPLAGRPGGVGSRKIICRDIQSQVPQRRPGSRVTGQSGSASSREGSGPGNTAGSIRDLDTRLRSR